MKNEEIELLIKTNQLRIRELDIQRIKSMLENAETNVKVIKTLPLNEETATVISNQKSL